MQDKNEYNKLGFLSNSDLKIIACIIMVIDHVGLMIFPDVPFLRIIGRIGFPIFAFLIAEGCKYSKNKIKRFAMMFTIGILMFIFYIIFESEIYGNIFLTFSVSIAFIYVLQVCKKWIFTDFKAYKLILSLLGCSALTMLLYFLFKFVYFEYDFWGMMLPVLISLFDFRNMPVNNKIRRLDCHATKLILCAFGLIFLSIYGRLHNIQYFCFLSLPILAMYNDKPGNPKLKYVFYIFYPAHLVLIYVTSFIIAIIK